MSSVMPAAGPEDQRGREKEDRYNGPAARRPVA
jgi:hypothetical protein